MAGIVLIAPDKQVYLQGKTLARELGSGPDLQVHLAHEDRAVALARKLEAGDVDVIVSRGGTARLIAQAEVPIPVVEIPVTAEDVVFMMREARRITGLDRPRVLMAVFSNWLRDAVAVAEIMGVDLTVYEREADADPHAITERINRLDPADFDIVIGGRTTVLTAARRGFRTLPTSTGLLALKNAMLEARRVALGRKIEKEHAQRFTALVQYASEGIVSVDRDGIIRVLNPAAERFLHCEAREMVGQRIDSCLGFVDVDGCLASGQESIGQIVQWGKVWLSFNIAPIRVDGHIAGAIVTFQDITRIQEMEARFRNEVLAKKFVARYTFDDIGGRSPRIEEARRTAREMAAAEAAILISGESGTGKELFAQSIHNASPRRQGPFVAVNCAALPANLLESELFGYVEGAFTGATRRGKPGLFEMAHRGTVFLDEISEMDKYGQSRLLRVLQEKQVMRLGDDKNIPVDVRVVAATNQDLAPLVGRGAFRQDLYYRLKVLTVRLPPLRARPGDIAVLAESFVRKYNRAHGRNLKLTPEAYDRLAQLPWPGNVRELMSFLERLVVVARERIITAVLLQKYSDDEDSATAPGDGPRQERTSRSEKDDILAALEGCHQNRKRAATLLGMDRTTLYRKLRRYGLPTSKGG